MLIEKARQNNIDRNLRFCPHCSKLDMLTVEKEQHFPLVCPLYDTLRVLYFKPFLENCHCVWTIIRSHYVRQ